MVKNLIQNWWAFVLQGVFAIGVGVAAFAVPGATLAAFLAVFAAYAIVSGLFEIVGGFSMDGGPKWSLVAAGALAVAVGALTVISPASTAVAATLLVGVYAIVIGVGRTSAAYMLRGVRNDWVLWLSAIASIAFGVLLIAAPGDGVLAILWLIGFYAIFAGITAIAFGLRLRGVGKDVSSFEQTLTGSSSPTTDSTATSR